MRRSPEAAAGLPPPPLRHPVRVATLDAQAGAENPVRLAPDADARARIARFLDIEAVERMALTGRLAPLPEGWEFRGKLTATVVQACVVTLEPVRSVIDTPVRRRFVRDLSEEREAEQMLGEADLDPPEPLGPEIDLGHVAVETLALVLDPWPRAEGAELDPEHAGDADGEADGVRAERPFAGLAALRARLGERGGDEGE